MATMSGIAGMGEAEELLSFDMFNSSSSTTNDPRTPLRANEDDDDEEEEEDETNTNTNNNMSYGSMSYGSMSMSINNNDDNDDHSTTTAGGSTRSSTRSSRRRNKRKNKENNSSSSNSFVSQNSSFLNSNSSVITGGGNSNSNSNSYLKRKEKEIDFILSQSPNIDLWKLRELALTPGGLVNDTLRKRAWPKLVGLDHNYDPLQFDDIIPLMDIYDSKKKKKKKKEKSSSSSSSSTTENQQQPSAPTIEIDSEHELLQAVNTTNDSQQHNEYYHLGPPSSTLLVESMDVAQIDRDVARCTWHLLTGSQRSRRSQHKSITQNSTRGSGLGRTGIPNTISPIKSMKNRGTTTTTTRTTSRHHHSHSAKYRRNRKIAVLLKKKQRRLANLINLTLVDSYDRSDENKDGPANANANPNRLRYYQGYHDVACIFLHALGGAGTNNETMNIPGGNYQHTSVSNNNNNVGDLELPSKVLCQISFSHFGDSLQSDFLKLQTGLKLILFPLLRKLDIELHNHLLDADMEPYFCLSWIITWFSHDIRDTALVKRLFDAFIVGHPLLPVYTALSMMTHPYNRRIILETDCDFAALHQCLASLPKHSCQVGYKKRQGDGYDDNIITYVSDEEGCCNEEDEHYQGGGEETIINTSAINNINSSNNDIDSYLDEEQSEFDDDNDTITSNYTNDISSCGTESSFPTSIAGGSSCGTAPMKLGGTAAGSGSLLSGSLASLQQQEHPTVADRTVISTEEADFVSKDSNTTLVSGSWGAEPWVAATNNNSNNTATITATSHDNNNNSNSNTEGTRSGVNMNMMIEDNNPVPFESVLDTALQYMKKYPPNSLVEIAKLYYSDDWDSQLSLLSSPTQHDTEINVQEQIALLNPYPPPWSIVSSCTSDWIEKQKLRSDLGLKPISRNDRRRRRNQGRQGRNNNQNYSNSKNLIREELKTIVSVYHNNNHDDHDNTMIDDGDGRHHHRHHDKNIIGVVVDPMEYVRCNPEDRVVAAIGYGPGLEGKKRQRQLLKQQRRRRRRRRTVIVAGCGVVFIGVLAMGGNAFYYNNDNSTSSSSSLFSITTKGWLFSSTSLLLPSLSLFSSSSSSSETTIRTAAVIDDDHQKDYDATMRKAAGIILPRLQNALLLPNLSKQPQHQQQQRLSSSKSSGSSNKSRLPTATPGMIVNKQPTKTKTNKGGDKTVIPTSSRSTDRELSSSTTSPSSSSSIVDTKSAPASTSPYSLSLLFSSSSNNNNNNNIIGNVIKHKQLQLVLVIEKTKQFMMQFIQHVWGFCRIFFLRMKNLKIIIQRRRDERGQEQE